MTVPKLRTVEQRMVAFMSLLVLIVLGFMFAINPVATAVVAGILVVLCAAILWIVTGA